MAKAALFTRRSCSSGSDVLQLAYPPLVLYHQQLLRILLVALQTRQDPFSQKPIRRGIAHFHLLFEDHVKIVFSRPRLQNLLHTHTHIALSDPSKPASDSQHHQPLAIAKSF